MQPVSPDDLKLDRTVISVGSLDDDDPDFEYWADATPEDRLRRLELLRRLNYGRRATGRLQRVLSVTTF
ncbi:MAG: hypothetical protein FJX72_15640 [Armatimonadetes bacterium]|nr:hypothetical protein [Armatimonadota bacterium]